MNVGHETVPLNEMEWDGVGVGRKQHLIKLSVLSGKNSGRQCREHGMKRKKAGREWEEQ
jgi:hypothetical protein